jgi:phage terminase small subunit
MAKSVNPEDKPLTESQKVFCNEWIFDFNGSRAYLVAYPASSIDAARSSASDLLSKPNIKTYCKDLKDNLSETAGISRLKVLREHEKLAFSSIAHLHNTWITRKEFEELTDDQKASIEEISTQTKTIQGEFESFEIEFVKIKLYSKQKSLDAINRMLGFDATPKLSLSVEETVKSFKIVPASERKGNTGK